MTEVYSNHAPCHDINFESPNLGWKRTEIACCCHALETSRSDRFGYLREAHLKVAGFEANYPLDNLAKAVGAACVGGDHLPRHVVLRVHSHDELRERAVMPRMMMPVTAARLGESVLGALQTLRL